MRARGDRGSHDERGTTEEQEGESHDAGPKKKLKKKLKIYSSKRAIILFN